MIDPRHETPRPAEGEGFGDAVTFAFGDPEHELYGTARLGLMAGEPVTASGLTILFHGSEVAAVGASGAVELPAADWTSVTAGDLTATVIEPLRAWEVSYDGDEAAFELRFDALGEPAEIGQGEIAASAAGLNGYEQLCRVEGTVRLGERRWTVACLGQRGHQWGAPDWERIELARTLAVWMEGDQGVALATMRPRAAGGHESEIVSAYVLDGNASTPIDDPRLSTAVDADGRQLRAGLELWVDEEGEHGPLRAAGEAVCGTTLDLGALRLDCSFFTWRMDGRRGVGRYDLLRRA